MTPTETKIYKMLCDGFPHTFDEILRTCFDDDLAEVKTLRVHISHLRKKVPAGLDIKCITENNRQHYMLIRLLNSPYDDRM